ncbi:MAG: DinB family protein [Flavobacteriales bacterium]|nr:DinB family protein [Flavobacteriales bacterium]
MLKQHLLDLFRYTDVANRKQLGAIQQLPKPDEAVKLFSHLITAQDKWMNRITKEKDDALLTWFGPVFPIGELEQRWKSSVGQWIALVESKSDVEVEQDVHFARQSDGRPMTVKFRDLALHLNYHAIHHRGQIATLIRVQGLQPPHVDYILSAIRET